MKLGKTAKIARQQKKIDELELLIEQAIKNNSIKELIKYKGKSNG